MYVQAFVVKMAKIGVETVVKVVILRVGSNSEK